jgi:hypothetical protein
MVPLTAAIDGGPNRMLWAETDDGGVILPARNHRQRPEKK